MWSASTISAEAAQHMQVDAGTLLKRFNILNPAAPLDSDILAATTGDFAINETAEFSDFLEDVNGAPNGTKEGARITKWTRTLGVSIIEITNETLKLALGAAKDLANGGISSKRQVSLSDFREMWWIGDMADETKLLAIHLKNGLSTGGLGLSTTKNGKGKVGLTITAHPSTANIEESPMEYFLLEKVGERDCAVSQLLSHVTSSFVDAYVENGDPFEATLTAEEGYNIANVVVTMGGEDVTSTAWNSGTSKVSIASATGDIVIVATAAAEGA